MRTRRCARRPRSSPAGTTSTASPATWKRWCSVSDWRPRLIVSDMDGTLLHWDETVSAATVAELQRWRADGVPFVLATGRPPRWMRDIREVIGWGTAVCCNGAVLLDLETFEFLGEELLQPDVLRA